MSQLESPNDFARAPRARVGPRPSSDSFRAIDVNALNRMGMLVDDAGMAEYTWRSGAWIHVTGGLERVELSFSFRVRASASSSEWEHVEQMVGLEWTPCNYGGRRPWFLCPDCGRRVGKLYGGARFVCRHCAGFAYATTREREPWRLLRRAQDIREQLGGSANVTAPFPLKPKHMRWERYWHLRTESEEKAFASLRAAAARFG